MSLAGELREGEGPKTRPEYSHRGIDWLVELWLWPERFFERELERYTGPGRVMGVQIRGQADARLRIVAWVCGMANVIDRLDLRLLREQFGGVSSAASAARGWPSLWASILLGARWTNPLRCGIMRPI